VGGGVHPFIDRARGGSRDCPTKRAEPRVLFLDEPTSGVDPIARRTFWTMIKRLADSGAAVLITTHY